MKTTEYFVEAYRNRNLLRLIIQVFCFGLATFVVASSYQSGVSALTQEQIKRDSGSLVQEIKAVDIPLSAQKCASLNDKDGIAAAGGFLYDPTVTVTEETGEERAAGFFIGELPAVWQAGKHSVDAAIGNELLAVRGEAASTAFWVTPIYHRLDDPNNESWTLEVVKGEQTVKQITTVVSSPSPAVASAVLIRHTPIGIVESCQYRAEAGMTEVAAEQVKIVFADDRISTSPYKLSSTDGFGAEEIWGAHLNSNLGLFSGAAVVLLLWAVQWTKRQQLVIYRTFGMPKVGTWVLSVVETGYAVLPPVFFGIATGWLTGLFITGRQIPTQMLIFTGFNALLIVGMALSIAPLFVFTISNSTLMNTLKER